MKCSWLATCCLQMRYVLLCLVDPLLVVWQEIFFGPHFTTTSHGYLDRTKPFSEEHMVIICCHGNFSADHKFSHALKKSITKILLFWYFCLRVQRVQLVLRAHAYPLIVFGIIIIFTADVYEKSRTYWYVMKF